MKTLCSHPNPCFFLLCQPCLENVSIFFPGYIYIILSIHLNRFVTKRSKWISGRTTSAIISPSGVWTLQLLLLRGTTRPLCHKEKKESICNLCIFPLAHDVLYWCSSQNTNFLSAIFKFFILGISFKYIIILINNYLFKLSIINLRKVINIRKLFTIYHNLSAYDNENKVFFFFYMNKNSA